MMRIGSSYEVVAAYCPLGIFPAPVYPIFRVSNSSNMSALFRQIYDSDGVVREYERVVKGRGDLVQPYFGEKVRNWIDNPAVYGFAMRANEIRWAKGLDEFRRSLRTLLEPGSRARLARTPFIALDVARFLEEDAYEAIFAGLAARRLAAINLKSAKRWVTGASLTEAARVRGLSVLGRPVIKSFRSDLTFPSVRIGYFTPKFAEYTKGFNFDGRYVKLINSLASYFDNCDLRSGDIVFLNWKEFYDVAESDILQAGEMGVEFGICFENDINPKHRILLNLPPCRIIKSVNGPYLAALVNRVVGC